MERGSRLPLHSESESFNGQRLGTRADRATSTTPALPRSCSVDKAMVFPKYLGGYKRQPELTETVKMTTMALLQGAPSVLKTASPFTARVNRSTALVPSGRRARSVALSDH